MHIVLWNTSMNLYYLNMTKYHDKQYANENESNTIQCFANKKEYLVHFLVGKNKSNTFFAEITLHYLCSRMRAIS